MNRFVCASLAVTATALCGAARADDLRPAAAASVDLGRVSGTAYYTTEPDGYRVVATLGTPTDAPMRVVSTLLPGQTIVLSSPGPIGTEPRSVRITRQGDRILVQTADTRAHASQ